MLMESILANTERITFHILPVSGKSFSSNRGISVIRCSRPSMQKSVSTFVTYNPSATVAGLSQYLWKLEQPAHAAANGYFMGCINRVGEEKPWNLGKFYGSSYHVDPRGQIFSQASEDKDELLIAEFDLDMIEEVRSTWQFYRDRRPETYGKMIEL